MFDKYLILQNNSKYGIIDMQCNVIVIPYIFDEIKEVGECFALKLNGKWGLLPFDKIKTTYDPLYKVRPFNTQEQKIPYYLFFDTETTGVPRNYKAPITDLDNWPRLVQLGWILCDKQGNELQTGNDIIKPVGFIIPEAASNVHKITTVIAMLKGQDLRQVLNKFISVSKQAKVLVGHNVSFDINIVGAELLRIKSDYSIANKTNIDTMLKSINYCAIPSGYAYGDKYKWPKLQELHKKLFGHEFEDAHDAMADIRATKKCFFEMKRIGLIIEESHTLDKHLINNNSASYVDDIPSDDLPF